MPNLIHLKMSSLEAAPHVKEPIDWLVCDINVPTVTAPRYLIDLEKKLKIGGYLIYTVKLPKVSDDMVEQRFAMFQQIFPNLKIVLFVHLLANSSRERCIIAEKVAESIDRPPEECSPYIDENGVWHAPNPQRNLKKPPPQLQHEVSQNVNLA